MGTLWAIYVRVQNQAVADGLLTDYPGAFTEPNTGFYAIEDPPCGYYPPESELCDLSGRLATDVVWLTFQSLVDAFIYHHWRSGVCLRSLVFGCRDERIWERSEGEPEPWERDAIFDPGSLAFWVEDASEAERLKYERIWREASLEPGQTVPSLDARETARKVAEHYRLPGWYLDDPVM